ncbi:MAG TPA: hypothetical protein VJ798_01080 [Rhizomicrobium sp.]|nr:hypothetical protein [Rhizomicrobium sp.]
MIAHSEAAAMLKTAEASRRHSIETHRYRLLSPYLYLWGVTCIFAYGMFAMVPGWFDPGFPLSILGAILGSVALSMKRGKEQGLGWRVFASFFLVWAFSVALFSILSPDPRQLTAYLPLLFGALITGFGFWLGMRYVVLGLVLGAASLLGFHQLGDYFHAWMAMVAGGSLLLAGFWLQRA